MPSERKLRRFLGCMAKGRRKGDMHIILVSRRLTKATSMTLSTSHLVGAALGLLLLVVILTTGLFYLTLRHAAELKLPYLESVVLSAQAQESRRHETFL